MIAAVTLGILPWTSGKLGLGPGKARLVEPIEPGETVESLLEWLAERLPGFGEWVDSAPERRVHEHCTLLVNGRAFEGLGGLATPLNPGDQLTILPGFSGGSPTPTIRDRYGRHSLFEAVPQPRPHPRELRRGT